jgi:hypothetical protein
LNRGIPVYPGEDEANIWFKQLLSSGPDSPAEIVRFDYEKLGEGCEERRGAVANAPPDRCIYLPQRQLAPQLQFWHLQFALSQGVDLMFVLEVISVLLIRVVRSPV